MSTDYPAPNSLASSFCSYKTPGQGLNSNSNVENSRRSPDRRPDYGEGTRSHRLGSAEVVEAESLLSDGTRGDGGVVDEASEYRREGDVAATGQVRRVEHDRAGSGVNGEVLGCERQAAGCPVGVGDLVAGRPDACVVAGRTDCDGLVRGQRAEQGHIDGVR